MPLGEELKLLSAFRKCRNVVLEGKINFKLIEDELLVVTELLKTDHLAAKLKGNLESLLECLILNLNLDFISFILCESSTGLPVLYKLFLECPADSALLSLTSALQKLSAGARQELCLCLFQCYFKAERFSCLLLDESVSGAPTGPFEDAVSQNLLTAVHSLPNKVANNTLGKFSDVFHHEQYFQLLAIQTGDAIETLVANVRGKKDVSMHFITQMVGQFCFSGNADTFLDVLLPFLIAKSSSDYVMRKISQKVFSSLPARFLETTVLCISRKLQWYGHMKWIFEDLILHDEKFRFLLLHKFILVKHFQEPNVLRNVIGYIADDCKTEHLLVETVHKLLSVWGNSSSIKHVSYEQHKYLTQAILICVGHLTTNQLEKHRHDLTAWLAPGVSAHLDSADYKIRRLGMVVGEAISQRTDFKGDNKLEFGYGKNDETDSLKELLTCEQAPTGRYYESLLQDNETLRKNIMTSLNKAALKGNGSATNFTTSKRTFVSVIATSRNENVKTGEDSPREMVKEDTEKTKTVDIDSDDDTDDDLDAFDMSNDVVYKKVKTPMYIRDCMAGLLEREDREKMEVCLGSVKTLIQKDVVAAKEISVELCKILLLLEDTFALDDFALLRMSAITELAVIDPDQVVRFLTREFYEENYCLQHRLDILDVLTASAKILSSVEKSEDREKDGVVLKELPAPPDNNESWRIIVDIRVEAKTRRFGKARKKTALPKENKFGPIAGLFFFPLLAGYDKRIRTMDLLGTDTVVLGRLLYTVGSIVYSAVNTMEVGAMSKYLLEFVVEMRFHPEAYVRQAALFCASMATITAGNTVTQADVITEITEWLNEVMTNDTNAKTKQLAAQTAVLMRTCLSNQFNMPS